MSKQWGHGFHRGRVDGMVSGIGVGQSDGGMIVALHAWHCTKSAIQAIEAGEDGRALGILRTMMYFLGYVSGSPMPELFNGARLEDGKQEDQGF